VELDPARIAISLAAPLEGLIVAMLGSSANGAFHASTPSDDVELLGSP